MQALYARNVSDFDIQASDNVIKVSTDLEPELFFHIKLLTRVQTLGSSWYSHPYKIPWVPLQVTLNLTFRYPFILLKVLQQAGQGSVKSNFLWGVFLCSPGVRCHISNARDISSISDCGAKTPYATQWSPKKNFFNCFKVLSGQLDVWLTPLSATSLPRLSVFYIFPGIMWKGGLQSSYLKLNHHKTQKVSCSNRLHIVSKRLSGQCDR